MRKIILFAAAAALLTLCLFCSCGDEGALSPADRAEKMVGEWDAAALNLYRYSGRGIKYDGHDGYMLVMTPDTALFSDEAALRDYQAAETARQCAGAVYAQLAACFSGESDFYIIVAICDASGKVLYTFLNGEAHNQPQGEGVNPQSP